MLTGAEYRHAIRSRTALQGKIDAYEAESGNLENMKEATDAAKEHLEEEMSFYNGFLGDAIEEYEAAHPPEE